MGVLFIDPLRGRAAHLALKSSKLFRSSLFVTVLDCAIDFLDLRLDRGFRSLIAQGFLLIDQNTFLGGFDVCQNSFPPSNKYSQSALCAPNYIMRKRAECQGFSRKTICPDLPVMV